MEENTNSTPEAVITCGSVMGTPMATLFLGPEQSSLLPWLRKHENPVHQTDQSIKPEYVHERNITFIVSYGYRHKISKSVLGAVAGRAVNLHISYLPWNRGADPNFWSFVEDTPKGVTIHYIDEGFDTGDIIAQRLVKLDVEVETLATSYEILQLEIQKLFKEVWPAIKGGTCGRTAQSPHAGTLHKSRDKERLNWLLKEGWNTPVSVLSDFAAENQISAQFWDKYDAEIAQQQKLAK
jgi:methionyl-tRNA formyltransferase